MFTFDRVGNPGRFVQTVRPNEFSPNDSANLKIHLKVNPFVRIFNQQRGCVISENTELRAFGTIRLFVRFSGGSNPIKTELRTLRTFENRTPNPSELWVLAQNRTPNPPNPEKTEPEPEPVRVSDPIKTETELSELLKTELRTHPNSGF